jgi:hypothetical protein
VSIKQLKTILGVVLLFSLYPQIEAAQETIVSGKKLDRFYNTFEDKTAINIPDISLSGMMRPIPSYSFDLGLQGYYGLDASIGSSGGVLDSNQLTFVAKKTLAMKWAEEQAKDAVWYGGNESVSLHVSLHGLLRCLHKSEKDWWVFFVSQIDVIASDGSVYSSVK